MTFEQAIFRCYGIEFRQIPADMKMRKFSIGRDEGFAWLGNGAGTFGNWTKNEAFGWDGGISYSIPLQPPQPHYGRQQMLEDQQIVATGNKLMDGGVAMTEAGIDRYILALSRVIENSNGR